MKAAQMNTSKNIPMPDAQVVFWGAGKRIICAAIAFFALWGMLAQAEQPATDTSAIDKNTMDESVLDKKESTEQKTDEAQRLPVSEDENSVAPTNVVPLTEGYGESVEGRLMESISNLNLKKLNAYRQAVKLLDENGPYHDQSAETLYGLGSELQKQGFFGEALDTYQRAMHVNRVNHGLYSLSQAPMLRGIISSDKALNLYGDVTTSYYRLLRLYLKNYEATDPALLAMLSELSLWHTDVYQIDKSRSQIDHLTSAHSLIKKAINNANNDDDLDYATKIDLLRTAALVSYYFSIQEVDDFASAAGSQYSASADKNFQLPAPTAALSRGSFRSGRIAHEQIIALTQSNPDATEDSKIRAYIETGDWHLIFSHRDSAMKYYQQAQAMIAQTNRQQELTTAWFAAPKILPAIRAEAAPDNPDALYATAQLDISEAGKPSHVNILEPTAEQNLQLRRSMIETIKNSRFRPRFVDNKPVESPDTTVRIPLIH